MKDKVLYGELSWPEVKEAVRNDMIPLIPIGSTEQHGPHMPTKTDAFVTFEVCKAAAKVIPTEALVMPPVNYGYNEHHLDFPATISIDYETLIRFVIDIGKSLAHHGFKRMMIVNGHGSNQALMEIAARRITLETQAICASLIYIELANEAFKELEAECGHAGDLETSLMLYLAEESVDMSKAVRDWSFQESEFIKWGIKPGEGSFSVAGGKVEFMDWWSRMSKTGILGDPTKANKARGKRIFDIYVDSLVKFIREFRRREIRPRKDYH